MSTEESRALVDRLRMPERKGGGLRTFGIRLPSQKENSDDSSTPHERLNDKGPGSLEGIERQPGSPATNETRSQCEHGDGPNERPPELPETGDCQGVFDPCNIDEFNILEFSDPLIPDEDAQNDDGYVEFW